MQRIAFAAGVRNGFERDDTGSNSINNDSSSSSTIHAPKIIYSSRTHSQLSKVIDELRSTSYRPSMAILGSRTQLCVNPEVRRTSNNGSNTTAMKHGCQQKTAARACEYKENLQSFTSLHPQLRTACLDIEDLVEIGTEHKMCPYFYQQEQRNNSDCELLLTPYNYIIDSNIRKRLNLSLNNAIVILDEGERNKQQQPLLSQLMPLLLLLLDVMLIFGSLLLLLLSCYLQPTTLSLLLLILRRLISLLLFVLLLSRSSSTASNLPLRTAMY